VHLLSFEKRNFKGVTLHPLTSKIFNSKLRYLLAVKEVKNLLKEIKPDILNAHYLTGYGLLGALSGFKPFIASAWGSDVLIAPKKSVLSKWAVKYVVQKADIITTESKMVADVLIQNLRADPHKIRTFPWGINCDLFKVGYEGGVERLRERLKINKGLPIILSNRSMRPLYRIDIIVDAAAKVLQQKKALFIFLKGDGLVKCERAVKLKAKRLGIEESSCFISEFLNQKEMVILANLADIIVSIPNSDAFPISVAEGMACGAIPIVSDLEVNREIIKDGENGFVLPGGDSVILAEKILYILEKMVEFKEKIIPLNIDYVQKNLNWRDSTKKMEAVYKEAIKRMI